MYFAVSLSTGHEGRIEEESRLRVGGELAVHLRVLRNSDLWKAGSTGGLYQRHMIADLMSVSRSRRGGVVADGVEVDDDVTGHHNVELRGDVFW